MSQASVIILKEWKKATASDKKIKNHSETYEAEEKKYEGTLRRYQDSHAYEM